MVKVERSSPAPDSLAEEKKKPNGSYSKPDVIEKLKKDFHNKCYICELDKLQDPQVEHLRPHFGGKILNVNLIGIIYSGHAVIAMELKISENMMNLLLIAVSQIQKRKSILNCMTEK